MVSRLSSILLVLATVTLTGSGTRAGLSRKSIEPRPLRGANNVELIRGTTERRSWLSGKSLGERERVETAMTQPQISSVSPFFIVQDGATALSFYRDQLGFDITYQEPADDPFFGIVCRGGAMIMLKSVGVDPLPNYKREPAARWDAYLYVPDPDALAAEFASRDVKFSEPLKDTHDGLRGFELKDADGYVLFFGRPRS
jgi:catechol 2,3-dioxygenase-like lactoylglutathione lyase family enzyme